MAWKFDNDNLRFVAAIMVVLIVGQYMYLGVQNTQIENILYMLVAFLVGGALLSKKNNSNE